MEAWGNEKDYRGGGSTERLHSTLKEAESAGGNTHVLRGRSGQESLEETGITFLGSSK